MPFSPLCLTPGWRRDGGTRVPTGRGSLLTAYHFPVRPLRPGLCLLLMLTVASRGPSQASIGFLRVLRVYRLARKVHNQTVVDVKNALSPTLERGASRQIVAIVATLLAYVFMSAGVVYTIEVRPVCSNFCMGRWGSPHAELRVLKRCYRGAQANYPGSFYFTGSGDCDFEFYLHDPSEYQLL